MRPVKVEWSNIRRFRGYHEIVLGKGVYGVVAEHESDSERSNWIGKTTLLELFSLALYGWHSASTEDALTTYGASGWSVTLTLSDGAVIKRSRIYGQSTQIEFHNLVGTKMRQKAAHQAIEQHIGLSKNDFLATSFVRQKHTSQFVTAGSSSGSVIEQWLAEDIDPIIDCCDKASGFLRARLSILHELQVERKACVETYDQIRLKHGWDQGVDAYATIQAMIQAQDEMRVDVDTRLSKQTTAALQKASIETNERQLTRVVSDGKSLRVELDGLSECDDAALAAQADMVLQTDRQSQAAHSDATQIRDQYGGRWDGHCPLVRGRQAHSERCPSRSWVDDRRPADAEVAAASQLETDALAKWRAESTAYDDMRKVLHRRIQLEGQLTTLRTQRDVLVAALPDEPGEFDNIDVTHGELSTRLRDVMSYILELKTDQEVLRKVRARVEAVDKELDQQKDAISQARLTTQIFHRAKREIAETAMLAVESGANKRLLDVGIDLRVKLLWERQGLGLANHCGTCSGPFPRSTMVTKCAHCGESRGPKMVQGFNVELSDVSGAADDLAGLAVCLSASEWLRARRGSQWSALFLDEPFGSLDGANRRALASHVAGMLSTFDMSLVVAHDRSVLDMLPNRIKILGTENGSKII